MVLKADWASDDIKLTFTHPCGPSDSLFWPSKDDVWWMPLSSVILKLNPSISSKGKSSKMTKLQGNEEFNDVAVLLS